MLRLFCLVVIASEIAFLRFLTLIIPLLHVMRLPYALNVHNLSSCVLRYFFCVCQHYLCILILTSDTLAHHLSYFLQGACLALDTKNSMTNIYQ